MKLHNFEMIVAIICFFKHFQSLQSAYYIGIVRSLYEKLHITFFFRPDSCSECFTWRSSNTLWARAFTSVFRTRRTVFANLGYEILTRTGEEVDWIIRTVEEERCHFKLHKFILTLFNIFFLCEVIFIFADQSTHVY